MSLVTAIAGISVLLFAFLLFLSQVIAHEIGVWLGQRDRLAERAQPEGVGVIVGGMLGLLAFVLALTLSFANSRFDERRLGSVTEANAIGTAWLQAEAIGGPRAERIADALRKYAEVRSNYIRGEYGSIDELNRKTSELQTDIWGHLTAIIREQPNDVTSSLMTSINDLFDASTAERFAFEAQLPPQLFWLLVGMAMLTMACLGYQLGIRGKPLRVLVAVLTLMWTAVIVEIFDVASSRLGNMHTAASIYEWTLQGLQTPIAVPPLLPTPQQ